jgi:hypothetical protein
MNSSYTNLKKMPTGWFFLITSSHEAEALLFLRVLGVCRGRMWVSSQGSFCVKAFSFLIVEWLSPLSLWYLSQSCAVGSKGVARWRDFIEAAAEVESGWRLGE